MKTIISCPVLPHRTTQSSCHIPKQRGVTVRSLTDRLLIYHCLRKVKCSCLAYVAIWYFVE